MIWAGAAKIPELAISEGEGREFAKRFEAVARHYNIQTTQKAVDWAQLLLFVGAVEGPRVMLAIQASKPRKGSPAYSAERTADGAEVLRPDQWHAPNSGDVVIDGDFDHVN